MHALSLSSCLSSSSTTTLELSNSHAHSPNQNFLDSWTNKLDVGVLIVCLLAAGSTYVGSMSVEIAEEYSDAALLMRYGVQVVRLVVFLKKYAPSVLLSAYTHTHTYIHTHTPTHTSLSVLSFSLSL
jgi:hypothetical protein